MQIDSDKIRCISLWQPWAQLIALGLKTVETRSWPAPRTLGNGTLLAIHASKRPVRRDECNSLVLKAGDQLFPQYEDGSWDIPMGAVVAVCRVMGSRPVEELRVEPYGDYSPGRHGWILKDIQKVEPITMKGRQGIWMIPTDRLRAI